ncbi:MAG: MerR family transcriptional regulator [Planctomycetia bacterium]|nr:MerR family transcriptional regulator [Planctomycetia bacterium]
MADHNNHIYPIGVVAKILDVSVQTLHLYEREGLILSRKTDAGYRIYNEEDIERLKCIRRLIEVDGLNLQGIKKLMAMLPCWTINENCKSKEYKMCPAYTELTAPCWALLEKPAICHEADCYICPVYKAPVECKKIKEYLH